MPYTGNPTTDTSDQIRLLIGDTSTGDAVFADAEIDFFNAQRPNIYLSAQMALESILGTTRASKLETVILKQVGDFREERAAVTDAFTLRDKIKALRMQGVRKAKPYAGGISKSDKDSNQDDSDRERPAFRVGMFDNPVSISTSTY